MRELIRLKNPGLTKLNNAEYLNLLTRAKGLILATGPDKLGIEADVMTSYTGWLDQLGDLVARSYAQAETPEMAELEEQRDALGLYIVDNVRNAQNVSIAAKPTEATAQFITELNAVIDEINVLYNLRTAQGKANTKEKEEKEPAAPAPEVES